MSTSGKPAEYLRQRKKIHLHFLLQIGIFFSFKIFFPEKKNVGLLPSRYIEMNNLLNNLSNIKVSMRKSGLRVFEDSKISFFRRKMRNIFNNIN